MEKETDKTTDKKQMEKEMKKFLETNYLKKEFKTLSSKIFPSMLQTPNGLSPMCTGIRVEDVKEFIKALKHEFRAWEFNNTGKILNVIDKLAGDDLVK